MVSKQNSDNRDRSRGFTGNQPIETSPWLNPSQPPVPIPGASFVEYLRWMRPYNRSNPYNDSAKLQLLQLAEADAQHYRGAFQQRCDRIRRISGNNTFEITCPWRIRVGGIRGPESILLPAFDAVGLPYLPASTLRGAARNQATREIMKRENVSWKEADVQVATWFGSLDAIEAEHQIGKVIFLDAYPTPASASIAMDIVNQIWSWSNETDAPLLYEPNPSIFFSLKNVTFLVGIRQTNRCDQHSLEQVKHWLMMGLQAGIGSQVNTGYGQLSQNNTEARPAFLDLSFGLEGQLIHGNQKINLNQPYQKETDGSWKVKTRNGRREFVPNSKAEAEVRSTAFKSILRYWFRALSMGVLRIGTEESLKNYLKRCETTPTTPIPAEVRTLEALLFGSINPQTHGWITVQIADGSTIRPEATKRDDQAGEQKGILLLRHSPASSPALYQQIEQLVLHLTWLVMQLGGIGQGARRPCYSRQNRDRLPYWRGSTFLLDTEDSFWELPETLQEFRQRFRHCLRKFYEALGCIINQTLDGRSLNSVGTVRVNQWVEVIDQNCRIVACSGETSSRKPYALSILHRLASDSQGGYNENLVGKAGQNGVKPSPIWISDVGDYQVVTVFGASELDRVANPRRQYLKQLRDGTTREGFVQLFPFPTSSR